MPIVYPARNQMERYIYDYTVLYMHFTGIACFVPYSGSTAEEGRQEVWL